MAASAIMEKKLTKDCLQTKKLQRKKEEKKEYLGHSMCVSLFKNYWKVLAMN